MYLGKIPIYIVYRCGLIKTFYRFFNNRLRSGPLVNKYVIYNELTSDQLDQLHVLMTKMWWCIDRTKDEITIMLKHCIPFAVIDTNTNRLVGFGRVLTDEIKYAYIYDVMTEESLRGIGIGKMIMNAILSHPELSRVKYFELTCAPDMVGYYEKFGFSRDYVGAIALRYQQPELSLNFTH